MHGFSSLGNYGNEDSHKRENILQGKVLPKCLILGYGNMIISIKELYNNKYCLSMIFLQSNSVYC